MIINSLFSLITSGSICFRIEIVRISHSMKQFNNIYGEIATVPSGIIGGVTFNCTPFLCSLGLHGAEWLPINANDQRTAIDAKH